MPGLQPVGAAVSRDPNKLDSYAYRPADPPWWPGDEAGYDEYHRQLYAITAVTNGFVRWKIMSSGMNTARQLAGARNRGRDAWVGEHGVDPAGWSLPHPPTVLWMPYVAHPACLGCMWLGDSAGDPGAVAGPARRHAASFLPEATSALRVLLEPLRVWQRNVSREDRAAPATAG